MADKHLIWWLGAAIALSGMTACAADGADSGRSGGRDGNLFGNASDPTGGGMPTSPGGGNFSNSNGGAAGSGGGGTATSGLGGADACASANVRASRTTPTVHLVIDGSGSMDEGFGGQSRWDALRSALMDPDGVLPGLENVVEFGMVMYDGPLDIGAGLMGLDAVLPGLGTGLNALLGSMEDCPRIIDVPPALGNFATIDMSYPGMPMGGTTPTHIALGTVVDRVVQTVQNVGPDEEINPQYIVLATDGAPNDFCEGGAGDNAQAAVIAAAQRGADAGVKMFVISLAGDDPNLQAHLEQVAQIGGTGNPPFTPSSKDELVSVLRQIIGGAVGCEVKLNGAVRRGEQCLGTVDVNGVELGCEDPNGWQLKDESTIELLGTACENFKINGEAMLHAAFPCGVFAPD